jgi:hypothetical protein
VGSRKRAGRTDHCWRKTKRSVQGKARCGIFPTRLGQFRQPPELAGRSSVLDCCDLSSQLMAALSINAIAENASRFGARIQESLSEHTRDLNVPKGTSSEFFETSEERLKNIHHQLDSNSDREKLDAMKRLIAVCFYLSPFELFFSICTR